MGEPYTLGTSVTIFIVITLIFFTLKVHWEKSNDIGSKGGKSGKVKALEGIYFLLILILQFVWNFSNAKYICGSAQTYLNVLFYTFIPNFFIFTTVLVIIRVLPGWLAPFSNTIGYGVVSCMGLRKTFNELLAPGKNELVTKICSDVSILINEMSVENYGEFMKTLQDGGSILKTGYKDTQEYKKLFHLVAVKQAIAEMLWYLFAGCLVISVSYNSIQDMSCTFTTAQMRKMHKDAHKKAQQHIQEQKPPVLYTKRT